MLATCLAKLACSLLTERRAALLSTEVNSLLHLSQITNRSFYRREGRKYVPSLLFLQASSWNSSGLPA